MDAGNSALEGFMRGQGIIAGASLIFYRAVLGAGATRVEALAVTQAYIAAMIYGKKKGEGE